jgi:hypothetical protein
MHVRTSTKRQNGKSYRYVQIVQSCWRNGASAKKVIGNLGDLPDQTVANLKVAFEASRDGRAVVIAPETSGISETTKVQANLRYLDVAVIHQVWGIWDMRSLLSELLPQGSAEVSSADVVTALVLQRCVAPGSKLYAERWFPTTALPELLGLPVAKFNNTRLHRVLEQLHAISPKLQQRLPALYDEHGELSSVFFIDVTDTWFEGHGCEMAERNRTKAGHRNKWTIGIVLLATERGYPLRWMVVSSKTKDHIAMGDLIDKVKTIDWIRGKPLVADRAMGREKSLHQMLDTQVHFLTAAPVNTIESYTTAIPYAALSKLKLKGTDEFRKQDIQLATQTARETDMNQIDDNLFILDLGVVEFEWPSEKTKQAKQQHNPDDLVAQLRLARQFQDKLNAGQYEGAGALARALDLKRGKVNHLLRLLQLSVDIQETLLDSNREVHVPKGRLNRAIKESDPDKQRQILGDVLTSLSVPDKAAPPNVDDLVGTSDRNNTQPTESCHGRLRLVAYFNPEMFVDQRRRADMRLEEINRFVEALNKDLAHASKSRKEAPTRRKITALLQKYDYTELFDVDIAPIQVKTPSGTPIDSFFCTVTRKDQAWQRRRQYDGFVLLLGHPDLTHSGAEIALLYRAKDLIEKDFERIKSVLKLRPIFHFTDPKVQAHVDICMLGLIPQRLLENRLRKANIALSTPACLEILGTCHLNRMKRRVAGRPVYSVTEPTTAQIEILRALGSESLVDDAEVARSLRL